MRMARCHALECVDTAAAGYDGRARSLRCAVVTEEMTKFSVPKHLTMSINISVKEQV